MYIAHSMALNEKNTYAIVSRWCHFLAMSGGMGCMYREMTLIILLRSQIIVADEGQVRPIPITLRKQQLKVTRRLPSAICSRQLRCVIPSPIGVEAVVVT